MRTLSAKILKNGQADPQRPVFAVAVTAESRRRQSQFQMPERPLYISHAADAARLSTRTQRDTIKIKAFSNSGHFDHGIHQME